MPSLIRKEQGSLKPILANPQIASTATRAYDRSNYDAEKRDALDRWARRLAAIVEGKTKKVSHSRLTAQNPQVAI